MNEIATECATGEISREFVRLSEGKERLHNRIGVLFDKLKDIMRKPEPQPTAETTKEMLLSQLAIDISSVSATIETDLEKIDDILARLEL